MGVLISSSGCRSPSGTVRTNPRSFLLVLTCNFILPPKLRRMCNLPQDADYASSANSKAEFDYQSIAGGSSQAFVQYCRYFYDPTFSIIARFTGIKETTVLCDLTESVFLQLWDNRERFIHVAVRAGLLFYTTMQVTLLYLKDCGEYGRVKEIEDAVRVERICRAIEKNINNGQAT